MLSSPVSFCGASWFDQDTRIPDTPLYVCEVRCFEVLWFGYRVSWPNHLKHLTSHTYRRVSGYWVSWPVIVDTHRIGIGISLAAATRNIKIIDTGVTHILWKKNREIKNLANSHPIWHDAKHRLLDHSLSKQKQRTRAETSRVKPIRGALSYLSSPSPSPSPHPHHFSVSVYHRFRRRFPGHRNSASMHTCNVAVNDMGSFRTY